MDTSSIDTYSSSHAAHGIKNESPKGKILGFAVAIIVGFGGIVVMGVGIGGCVGSISSLDQVQSLIMVAAGSGGSVLFLVVGSVGLVKNCSLKNRQNSKSDASEKSTSIVEQKEEAPVSETDSAAEESVDVEKSQQKPRSLEEQAQHAALSFKCQSSDLPRVALTLGSMKRFMGRATHAELITMSGRVSDQALNAWTTETTKYLDARWAWPAASGKYSVIRQLITDPNLNGPLKDSNFILAIFARNQLGSPIKLFELDVAEMLIAGFRDQHPALLECQPYNNAFFVEDIHIVHDSAHEERLLKSYLIRKECTFVQVMQAIEAAAQEYGVESVSSASASHFDAPYGPSLWERGNVMKCFQQLKLSLDSENKFVVPGHTFAGSYGQSLQGLIALCRILYPKSVLVDAHPNFGFVSSDDLAEKIAHHPTLLLEYDICHLWYDAMHLKAMFAGQKRTYAFKDGHFAMIDIVEKILLSIQKAGLKPDNAITAQQLYLRLFALADLK